LHSDFSLVVIQGLFLSSGLRASANMGQTQPVEIENPAVRSFLRSLNTLLKSARMYGMAHAQTIAQANDAWEHLQAVLSDGREGGLQLAVSENRLLVDGLPVKRGPAEQSFVQFLTAADLTSVTFTTQVMREAFLEMVRIFGESGSKPEGLAEKLKGTLGDETKSGIRINEIRFVPAGSDRPEKRVAAQLLAQTLGVDSAQMQGLLDDPLKLLELITAAEGASQPTGSESTTGTKTGPPGRSGAMPVGSAPAPARPGLTEEETGAVIRLLSKLAREGKGRSVDPAKLRREFSGLPQSSQETLHQALIEFAQSAPRKAVGTPLLLQVAEHLAVQLALDRYQKGDARVDAVTEMLNRLNREVDSLRETLGSYEEKLKRAGFEFARPSNSLEEQFWARAPESAKLDVLLSDQAWRVPTHYIRQYLDQLPEPDEAEKFQQVLVNYASCIHSSVPEARHKTAVGLKDLAGYYSRPGGQALRIAIGHAGEELARERDARLQNLISTTFVLLGQEAATRRRYAAILQMMSVLQSLEKTHEEMAASLRARVGLENRLPDFLEEVLRVREASGDLIEVLRRMPLAAAEHLAGRISRCARRRERDRLVRLAEALGPEAAHALGDAFRFRPPAAAVIIVGLLSRIDPAALEEVLLVRLREWSRVYQDAAVRHIASAGSPGRGLLLAKLLDGLDPLVAPLALDEIGMSGDTIPAPLILGIAAGELPKFTAPFLRIKAIEALGRLRVREAIPLLRQLVESKDVRHGRSPKELRVVAAQSLQKMDPEGAKTILSSAGLRQPDLEPMPFDPNNDALGVRQRYYPRVKFPHALAAKIITADGDFSASVRQLSLGGGICSCEHRLLPGTPATIRIKKGLRSFAAKSILRDARSEHVAFEIVDMDLEDRARFRAMLQAVRS
jgi:hypothetical protein